MEIKPRLRVLLIICFLTFIQSQVLWGQFQKTKHGIILNSQGHQVELAVANAKAFRLSIRNQGESKTIQSIFIDNETQIPASFKIVSKSPVFGIETSFGKH